MTCDEFWAISVRNPMECSRAERAAHYVHLETCRECAVQFADASRKVLRELTQRVPPEELRSALEEAHELSKSDLQDPEVAGQLLKSRKREGEHERDNTQDGDRPGRASL